MTETLRAHVFDPSAADLSVRPQDDLFRHVNGSWLREHPIPPDRPSDGEFYALRELSEKRGRAIVQDAVNGRIDDPDARRIATLYGQFLDERAIESQGTAPLQGELAAVRAAATRRDLARLLGTLHRTGVHGFVQPFVNTDMNDTDRYIVYLEQSGLGLPDESYYSDDKYRDARTQYAGHIARTFELAGIGAGDDARRRAARVLDFETRLASHQWDQVSNRDAEKANNPRAWERVRGENPGFDWSTWVAAIGLDPRSVPVFNLDQPDYVQAAAALWESTDLDVLRLWVARALLDARAPYLPHAFVDESFQFYGRVLAGTQRIRPRWKRGMGLIEWALGEALGRLYVQRYFPPRYKTRMEELVGNIIAAYRDSIAHVDWLGEATRSRALQKLDQFRPKIAYPPKWRDYSALRIEAARPLLDNVRAAASFATDYELHKLGRPVDRDEWLMTPQTVNAYYNPTMNEIVFPAAILQPPFFDPDADDAVNYGAIGAVIGHEIGHGFDDQGSHFDGTGRLRNWWTDEDRREFDARTKALAAQYDAYSPRSLPDTYHVNGSLTLGENIGDLGGLTIAWRAWLKALGRRGLASASQAPELDGLTGARRFFYSWARAWRSKTRDEFQIQLLAIDPHSPAEFRCNGTVRNMDAFARAFDLAPGDGLWLAPEERVRIW